MKKLILFLSIIWTAAAFGQVTTGFHRTNQLLARGNSGTYAQVVPNASIHVTSVATGLLATIYRDPLLTSQIVSGTVTTDASGNYDYYIPLNYCVTETDSYPGGGFFTTTNICASSAGIQTYVIGSIIASSATISPTSPITHVSGVSAIATITPPSGCLISGNGCSITLIPDGLWTTTTSGNIALASVAVVGKAEIMTYDSTTSKWYPSY